MIWFLLTISCIILWGITDILLKKSLHPSDPISQFKTLIWIGLIMAPAGGIMAICSKTLPNSFKLLTDNLDLIPLCIFYVIAVFFGLLGKKNLDVSVVSPLENIDGAIAAIVLYFFFLFTVEKMEGWRHTVTCCLKYLGRYFPGDPVTKTPCFRCRVPRFDP